MNGSDMTMIVTYIVGSLLVFLVCREIVCWYFKMNEVTKLLREIKECLKSHPSLKS